jgi:hypothetical protein
VVEVDQKAHGLIDELVDSRKGLMTTHPCRPALTLGLLMLALVRLPASAHAQGAGTGTLRGTVLDTSLGVVAGATVELTSVRTSARRQAISDERGAYVFPSVLSGPYRLRVTLAGFAPWESSEVHVSPGDSVQVDAILALGRKTEVVNVLSGREMVRTDHGAREGLITAGQIQNLSLVGRGVMELLRVLPGTVTPDQSSLETVGFVEGSNILSAYSVNGNRGTNISPVLDGSKIIDVGSNNNLMVNINPDMVEEVKVQAANYAAEYGSPAVQVSAVTKGGSASFHGAVYDYWRNWRFAANDRSNSYAGVARPESLFHCPGFNLSGPVLVPGTDFNKNRDRLFFFVGFELQRQTIDKGTTFGVVPTQAQRQGDFSELLTGGGQNLAQPRTVTIPAGFPGAGQPAPNNDLRSYVDPTGQALLDLYPESNYSDPENRYNYAFTELMPLNRWQLTSRVDWNVTEATHAYVRLALETEDQRWARGLWVSYSPFELPSRARSDSSSWSVAANVTSILSPSLTNEIVVSASRLEMDHDWEDLSKVSAASLGLEGFQGIFGYERRDAPIGIVPAGQGLGELFAVGGFPLYAHNDSVSVSDTLTKVTGAHTLKLGVFVERGQKQQNTYTDLGRFILASPWVPGTGNDYGDLLVGRLGRYRESTPSLDGEFRFWNVEGFVQDSWKVRRNLTLEAGLRVARLTNDEERNGLGLRFEPSAYDFSQGSFIDGDPARPNGVLLASRGEIPRGLLPDRPVMFLPRLNFAWDVGGDGALVLRGGAGLFANRWPGVYYSISSPPNAYNVDLWPWDVPGGLTIASLSQINPWSRLAAGWVDSVDSNSQHVPRTSSWSLALIRRLPWEQRVEVAYVGHRADHLFNQTRLSYIRPGTLMGPYGNADLDNPLHRAAMSSEAVAHFRTFPAYNLNSFWYQYEARSSYNALQVTLSRQTGGWLRYFLNYTFSKALGTTGGDVPIVDPLEPGQRSYGLLQQDRTHVFNASYNLLLPDLIPADGNGVLRGLLNGWQISGITSYRSGAPFRVVFGGDLASEAMARAWYGTDAHLAGDRANSGPIAPGFVGDPRLDNTEVGERILDIDQIGIPALGESGPLQQPYDFRAPSRWNWDVTLMKNLPLGGAKRIQLRVGVFNLFNQAVPDVFRGDVNLSLQTACNVRVDGVPNGTGGYTDLVCDPTQGFHYTEDTLRNFGKIITKRGHRVVELAVRFDF